jgi:hypothetical protein
MFMYLWKRWPCTQRRIRAEQRMQITILYEGRRDPNGHQECIACAMIRIEWRVFAECTALGVQNGSVCRY